MEWNFDWYPGYSGAYRVQHGGSWTDTVNFVQVGGVNGYYPYYEYNLIGFRLARIA